jgi:hypothetical protein
MRAVLIRLAKYHRADLVGRVLKDVRSLLVLPPPGAAVAVLKEAKKEDFGEPQARAAGTEAGERTQPTRAEAATD